VLLGRQPTPAELRVLALLATDLTLKQIAEQLYLSINTVSSHRKRLYRRLGAKARAEAVEAARERSLL
jgi:LuxR family transcriptional regulator, maltose regulon positive regulatory protein